MDEPRGRLRQGVYFEVDELRGCIVEEVLGYTDDAGRSGSGRNGTRATHFATIREICARSTMAAVFGLLGARLIRAFCRREGLRSRILPAIEVGLDAGTLLLSYAQPDDLEADRVLTFEAGMRYEIRVDSIKPAFGPHAEVLYRHESTAERERIDSPQGKERRLDEKNAGRDHPGAPGPAGTSGRAGTRTGG